MKPVGAIATAVTEGLARTPAQEPVANVPARLRLTHGLRGEAARLGIAGAEAAPLLTLLTTIVRKCEATSSAPSSAEVVTILTYARLIKANLKVPEGGEKHLAWAIAIAQAAAPTAPKDSIKEGLGGPLRVVVSSASYLVSEVEQACTRLASNTGHNEWPSLKELLSMLRSARDGHIAKSVKCPTPAEPPRRTIGQPESHRRAQVWSAVVADVARGRVPRDDASQRAEVERRLLRHAAAPVDADGQLLFAAVGEGTNR